MTTTQINGGTQIRSGTITTTQLSSSAGITDGQLASVYLYADGTRAMTGNLQGGAHEATNFSTPTASTSLATKGYVDSIAQGLPDKYSARAATTGVESFTVASGNVTQIAGTSVDGQSPSVGEYILVKDAPAATGTGSVGSNQPGNGLYQVTNATTNLTLTRAADMSGVNAPQGAYVFVQAGTTNASSGWVVSAPSTSAAFTYGTGTIQWTQFSGAGEISVDSTLVKTGNQLARAAITGNVTIASGSNSAVIPSSTVTVAMLSATGTASSTTYLSGSGVWSTPTPASGTVTFAMLATAAVVTSTGGISSGSTDTTVPTAKAVYSYVTSAMAGAGAGTVTTVSVVSANGFAGSVSNASSTPAITISTSITGLLKGNGTAISAATVGTDYLASSSRITRETPSGTINGSNTAFTLANTPTSGTEEVFLNGILQDSGGNDYSIATATITFVVAPQTNDKIRVSYFK